MKHEIGSREDNDWRCRSYWNSPSHWTWSATSCIHHNDFMKKKEEKKRSRNINYEIFIYIQGRWFFFFFFHVTGNEIKKVKEHVMMRKAWWCDLEKLQGISRQQSFLIWCSRKLVIFITGFIFLFEQPCKRLSTAAFD